MLDIEKCGLCGKAVVIEVGKKPICDDCREEEQKLYQSVRRLLRDNHGTRLTISDVAELMGVEEKKITYLVDRGYFQLVKSNLLWDGDHGNRG